MGAFYLLPQFPQQSRNQGYSLRAGGEVRRCWRFEEKQEVVKSSSNSGKVKGLPGSIVGPRQIWGHKFKVGTVRLVIWLRACVAGFKQGCNLPDEYIRTTVGKGVKGMCKDMFTKTDGGV